MLKIKNLNICYKNNKAVSDVSLKIERGEAVALIGPNGAGKSTILKAISGLLNFSGEILFCGENIKNLSSEKIVKHGLSYVPEGRKIFLKMSVQENLEVGGFTNKNYNKKIIEIYDMFPILKERKSQIAGTLSGGEQQILAIGRALMSNPKFLSLDEPSMGLSPKITDNIFEIIKNLKNRGITILLVEQNIQKVLSFLDWVYVIKNGKISLLKSSADLINS